MAVRIILADDHKILREGLRLILARHPEIEVIAEANTGREALEQTAKLHPDVIVMDIAMPDLNGIEATRQILKDNPNTKVIALSLYADRSYVLGMLEAGASAYVLKANAGDELLRAIQAVIHGRKYLSAEITDRVVDSYTQRAFPSGQDIHTKLGTREREVLQLLAEGHSSKNIADLLHISIRTAETHRRNIMNKLGLHNMADLIKYAIRHGLTSLDD
jgi:DNA-binding NarL/FixJ family response regulator